MQSAQKEVEFDVVDEVDIPSCPTSPQIPSMMTQVSQPQYQPFQMGASQFVAPEPRVCVNLTRTKAFYWFHIWPKLLASLDFHKESISLVPTMYSKHHKSYTMLTLKVFFYLLQQPSQQQNFGLSQTALGQSAYGLSQTALGQSPFSQNSLFLPTTPTQPDNFQQLPLSFQRNQMPAQPHVQPFGQPQPNTIMVSSATSSLMSTTIKPPNQSSYGESYLWAFFFAWISNELPVYLK